MNGCRPRDSSVACLELSVNTAYKYSQMESPISQNVETRKMLRPSPLSLISEYLGSSLNHTFYIVVRSSACSIEDFEEGDMASKYLLDR